MLFYLQTPENKGFSNKKGGIAYDSFKTKSNKGIRKITRR